MTTRVTVPVTTQPRRRDTVLWDAIARTAPIAAAMGPRKSMGLVPNATPVVTAPRAAAKLQVNIWAWSREPVALRTAKQAPTAITIKG